MRRWTGSGPSRSCGARPPETQPETAEGDALNGILDYPGRLWGLTSSRGLGE